MRAGERVSRRMTPAERFWSKVDKSGECWLWTASVISGPRGGYGQFRSGGQGSKMVKSHVWAYEQVVGLVPEGSVLDHLCRNRRCVNPDHLDPVTVRENVRRGAGAALKTECKNGHPYTADNVRVLSNGWRTCRLCYIAEYQRSNAKRASARRHAQ